MVSFAPPKRNNGFKAHSPLGARVIFDNRNTGEIYTRHDINANTLVYRSYREPKHYVVKYHGFGISVRIFNYLQEQGVQEIEIVYRGKEKLVYRTKLEAFGEKGICDKLGEFEPQLFLPETEFEKKRVGA